MWKTGEVGIASWQTDDATWNVDARGGTFGIVLSDSESQACLRGEPVEADLLPVADEHYVRGRSWHVNYPQGDSSFALRLVLTPVIATATRLVLETTVAIQTSLLDTHPKLDLTAEGNAKGIPLDEAVIRNSAISGIETTGGSPPISLCSKPEQAVAVLLASYDSPFTTELSSDGGLRLRLFGDFLEKGVIRKARPWIVVDRSSGSVTADELNQLWAEQQQRPLPLTA